MVIKSLRVLCMVSARNWFSLSAWFLRRVNQSELSMGTMAAMSWNFLWKVSGRPLPLSI